ALGKKALIVTDPFMIQFGNVAKLEDMLKSHNAPYAIFSDITGEPTDKMVEAGLKMYADEGCDYLIALGGGSCIDTMKAIAVVAAGGGAITDYMGRSIEEDVAPMVAIPTTAGTGSEATRVTIIADTVNQVKMMLIGSSIVPPVAVIDPQFTMTAPPSVTANTGLDALCHCMEAYTSRRAQPLTDTFALSAVKRIVANLSTCYHDGKNVEARAQMSIAALEAGIAFTNASVTIIHGMSRPIGALFHVPHGTSNAMLIKVCLPFMLTGCYDRFADLGRAIGVAADDDDDKTAAEKFQAKVMAMVDEMGIPTPAQFGIDKDAFFKVIDKMADDALTSGSPQNTWHQPTKEDLVGLYKKLWD
ncbi:MAG: iron-containing alcohol dehydrogenase, partial [Sarcina sp.]|nr:iron-containing alcohol dehydrogenase [Sarcina sp.]